MRFPLPKDTASILTLQNLRQCRNLGLWLDKFRSINDEQDDNGEDQWKLSDATKRRDGFSSQLSAPIPSLLRSVNARRTAMFGALRSNGTTVRELTAELDYRLILGFGAEHVLETNIDLHRIYGFPIIPGSAVKGVTRACAFWDIAIHFGIPSIAAEEAARRKTTNDKTPLQLLDQLLTAGEEEDQQKALAHIQNDPLCRSIPQVQELTYADCMTTATEFYKVFGTTSQRGEATFFDAYPIQTPRLELDVLNPHYGKYYRGEAPPADYLDPVPTYFLTVAKGNTFHFAIATNSQTLADRAVGWLSEALGEIGIGGKTSAGYGFMQVQP